MSKTEVQDVSTSLDMTIETSLDMTVEHLMLDMTVENSVLKQT